MRLTKEQTWELQKLHGIIGIELAQLTVLDVYLNDIHGQEEKGFVNLPSGELLGVMQILANMKEAIECHLRKIEQITTEGEKL